MMTAGPFIQVDIAADADITGDGGKIMAIFGPNGIIMRFCEKVKQLMCLGILTLIFCIPVVTIGAAWTALNYVSLKIVRGEEGYIVRDFWKSFKSNFKQSTIMWMIFVGVGGFFAWELYIMNQLGDEIAFGIRAVILIAIAVIVVVAVNAFILQAKFVNTIKGTVKSAVLLSITKLPRTLLMIILYLLPGAIGGYLYELLPFAVLFGLSLPAYLSALLYNQQFKALETLAGPERESAQDVPGEIQKV